MICERCPVLDALYEACWWDVGEKEGGQITCWIPYDTAEYFADPLHARWNRRFIAHKKKCKKCMAS